MSMGDWIYRNRLTFLLTCIAAYYLLQVSDGLWVDDFWDHSAAVSALMRDLMHPRQAQLAIDQPFVFFTPYSLMVACAARIFGLSSIDALALFGLFNGALLVYGLRRYLRAMEIEDEQGVLFYGILCILFLWGTGSWGYSGFFHIDFLKFVLPYPSAFATGLALLGLALNRATRAPGVNLQRLAVLAILVVVMLSHPVAFVFMVAGLFADAVTRSRRRAEAILTVLILVLAAVALSLLWPYYPFVRLSLGAANVYHLSNGAMYLNVLGATWPVIVLLPFAGRLLTDARNRPLVVTAVLLLGLYVAAGVVQKYSYGRVISYVMLLSQLVIAQRIAMWDRTFFSQPAARRYGAPLIVLALCVLWMGEIQATVTRALTAANSLVKGRPDMRRMTFGHLEFLRDKIEPGSVVLANLETSWIIPTFGAKVVALLHPHAFIEDLDRRRQDLEGFFSTGTPRAQRARTIEHYGVRYILLSKTRDAAWQEISDQFSSNGGASVVYEDPGTVLIKLAVPGSSPTLK